jgi:Cu+-exporting ATPase
LSFAVIGQLSPLYAALLMPLSSVTVVGFVTLATNLAGRKVI